jgi:hypothetical protein
LSIAAKFKPVIVTLLSPVLGPLPLRPNETVGAANDDDDDDDDDGDDDDETVGAANDVIADMAPPCT